MSDAYKLKGNEFFKEKRYSEAIEQYTKAIEKEESETNPNTDLLVVYYNNRAAALHLNGEYNKSLTDAKKSIELDSSAKNTKGYLRAATALWAQKNYADAKKYYQTVINKFDAKNEVALDGVKQLSALLTPAENNNNNPKQNEAMENLNKFRSFMNTKNNSPMGADIGGEWKHVHLSYVGLLLNLILLSLAPIYLASLIVFPNYTSTLFYTYAVVHGIQQLFTMYKLKLIPYLTKPEKPTEEPFLKTASKHYCSSVLILFMMHFALKITPITYMIVYTSAYNLTDLLFYNMELLKKIPVASSLVRVLEEKVLRRYDIEKENHFKRDQFLTFAAMIEALLVFTIFLFGGSWFTLMYIQYTIYRYHNDKYMQFAFRGIKNAIETNVMNKSFIPAIVKKGYYKLLEGIELTAYLK
ncbi:hypothetical protein ADEAN_000267300 [Angomonas deanei]|uniref:Uncharacterized protein n=1 Tax=Angomonas deanei TaxID=59799 RepID=A0A7G2C5Z4_9TRYP|nr:hypothetical protein ADEAN_000267300 [Angomonas deanei]